MLGAHQIELPHVHFPRKALAVDVSVRGAPLRFYSTHFDYGEDASAARAAAAAAILADLPAPGPAIVAGDLNAGPAEPGPADLAAALVDLWPAANPSQTGATMPAGKPTRRIDYLFASPSLGGKLLGAKLLDEHDGALWLSDHRGVAAAVLVP
ncbi:MAG: endonuclease/exonuclease/phosphatase family protein [Deltaproteobacteria bacterium]|nr:endonuclease/exonuclease/phosphatase family protein [Deltaproteobacteria bacterium]